MSSMPSASVAPAGFGPLLRQWRTARRMSQQQLAIESEVSTRHISYVENGKSSPSREMVLILASAKLQPPPQTNVEYTRVTYGVARCRRPRVKQLSHGDRAAR